MNETTSAGLRLPVLAAVDRTPEYGALGDGAGVEASFNFGSLIPIAQQILSSL